MLAAPTPATACGIMDCPAAYQLGMSPPVLPTESVWNGAGLGEAGGHQTQLGLLAPSALVLKTGQSSIVPTLLEVFFASGWLQRPINLPMSLSLPAAPQEKRNSCPPGCWPARWQPVARQAGSILLAAGPFTSPSLPSVAPAASTRGQGILPLRAAAVGSTPSVQRGKMRHRSRNSP
jgi:hypothetical protein